MSNNPYDSSFPVPQSNRPEYPDPDQFDNPILKEAMLSMARWQTFFVILGFLTIGLMLGYFAIIILTSLTGGMGGMGVTEIGASMIPIAIVLLIYGLPTLKLLQASSKARSCVLRSTSLTEAMIAQRGFWRTTGIIVAISISLYILVLFFVVLMVGTRMF